MLKKPDMTPSLFLFRPPADRALRRKGGRTIHIVISTSRIHLSCREQFYSKFVICRIVDAREGGRQKERGEKGQSLARRVVTTMNRFRGNKTKHCLIHHSPSLIMEALCPTRHNHSRVFIGAQKSPWRGSSIISNWSIDHF